MKKYKIIIVENDKDEQFFMEEGFKAAGLFELVTQLSNGDVLFQWLDEHKAALPDVILSDLNMPGKDGYNIIEEIAASPDYKHIPVIITSTSFISSVIDKCLAMGAADYMVKPDSFVEYVP